CPRDLGEVSAKRVMSRLRPTAPRNGNSHGRVAIATCPVREQTRENPLTRMGLGCGAGDRWFVGGRRRIGLRCEAAAGLARRDDPHPGTEAWLLRRDVSGQGLDRGSLRAGPKLPDA